MGKDTEIQRRHGLTYERLAAGAAGAAGPEFDTRQVANNRAMTIETLCKQLEDVKLDNARLRDENTRLRSLLNL